MKYFSPRISPQVGRKYATYFGLALLLVAIFGVGSQNTTAFALANARPQQVTFKFTAKALYGGDFKYGNWLPIEAFLQNDGGSTTVQLETTINSEYNNNKFASNYKRTVSLDQRTSKKVILYVPPFAQNSSTTRPVAYQLEVRLLINGEVIDTQSVQVQPIDNADYLIGMIGVKQATANTLDNTRVGPLRSRVTTTVFAPQDLADRVEGLGSFDALALSNVSTDGLTKDQQTALKSWVSNGGTLLLMGGTGWSKVKAGLDSSLLPFQVYDYANTKDLNGLAEMLGDKPAEALPQEAVVARGQVLQGASPMAIGGQSEGKNDASPLAVQRVIGEGRVIALAADLTVPPLTEWGETTRLWQNFLNYSAPIVRTTSNDNSTQYSASNNYFQLVSSLPAVELPNLWPFFIMVGIYVIVVGPLNYLLLRRIKRPGLAWLTIPVSIIFFTGMVFYLFVKSQSAGQALVNQISVIQADAATEVAQVQAYVAVFSPEDKNYQVKMDLPATASFSLYNPLLHPTNIYGPVEAPNTILEDGHEARVENFHIGQWGVQGFSMQTNLNGHSYKLQADLHFQDGAIVGSVRNNTNQHIHDAMLVYGDQLVRIKDIDPGETAVVKVPLVAAAAFDNTLSYCANGYSSYNAYATNPVTDKLTTAWQNRADDKELANRLEVVKRLFQDGSVGPLSSRRNLDLIGWLDDSPTTVSLANTVTQVKARQLLIENLPVSFETKQGDGHLAIPVGFLRPDSATDERGNATPTNRVDRLNQTCLASKSSVTVQYHLPTQDGPFKVQHLQLYLNAFVSSNGHTPAMPDSTSLYDWQSQSWIKLNNLVNNAKPYTSSYNSSNANQQTPPPTPSEIEDAARFANPQTGLVLLRFDSSSTQTLQIQFHLAAQGTH